jgi:hypothetical protein
MRFLGFSWDFDDISEIFVGFDGIFVGFFGFQRFSRSRNQLFSPQ